MTTQQRIDVMLAADAGKKIQKRYLRPGRYSDSSWVDANNPGWNFFAYEYRVAPEPVVKYRVQYSDGSAKDFTDVDKAINHWKNSVFNPTLQEIKDTNE